VKVQSPTDIGVNPGGWGLGGVMTPRFWAGGIVWVAEGHGRVVKHYYILS